MNIRAATADDTAAIHSLGQTVSEFSVSDNTVTFWPKELLLNAIRSDEVLILVAEAQGIAGFLIVNYNSGLKKALIENIYVKPEMRGQGAGDKLLEKMLELLPGMGCEYVATLVPLEAHDAADLYQAHGFSRGQTFLWLDKPLSVEFEKQ